MLLTRPPTLCDTQVPINSDVVIRAARRTSFRELRFMDFAEQRIRDAAQRRVPLRMQMHWLLANDDYIPNTLVLLLASPRASTDSVLCTRY